MLRSFDYIAAASTRDGDTDGSDLAGSDTDGSDLAGWATRTRTAFLAGYAQIAGAAPEPALLRALELDKAVYEATYEARHRPTWLPIPLRAVERLSSR
jgi:Uncharacterized protein, probably involved in trehalose biosynthesis